MRTARLLTVVVGVVKGVCVQGVYVSRGCLEGCDQRGVHHLPCEQNDRQM